MNSYIGLDAHSKTCTFVAINAKGQDVACRQVKTSEIEILNFVRSIPRRRHLTFEESHMAKWLYPILKDEVDELIVCNPTFISARSGAKNDLADTRHMAQQLRGNFLTPVFHSNHFFADLRSIVSAYEDVTRQLTREKNRYKALFRSEARETEGSKIYGDRDRIKELTNETDRFVAEGLFDQIYSLKNLKIKYQGRFIQYTKDHPEIKALTSIPGISDIRANIIAAIVCTPLRFESKHKFWAYCMLVRHDNQSDGKSYGKKTIHANTALKNVFMGAAESALKTESALRKFYDGHRSKELDHQAAKKNLARKIATIALAVMKTKKPYEDEKVAKENE